MQWVRSRLLADWPHGFTTREGGVSVGAFATLNLGGRVGDDAGAVEANWARLREATGLAFARVRQVHGSRVVDAAAPGEPTEEADGVVSGDRGVAACVAVADCVPILVADPRRDLVAAVHAGWRGTLARAAARGVEALVARGSDARDLLAAVGPAIGPCCYEVSPELAARFRAELGPDVASARAGGGRVDLWLANELVLRSAGLAPARIEVVGRCTSCEDRVFFSHRRDRGRTGRQVGFVAPRPA